ncbi:MAG: hypothetical protein GXY34_05845 [Syntrophomonadaceae bacterium]|nr:hypothetical protein [Syntrophomonadaceae bacterium]
MKRAKKIFLMNHYSYLWNIVLFFIDLLPPVLRNMVLRLMFDNFGKLSFLDYKTYWRYPRRISIGDYTSINRGCGIYPSFFVKEATIRIGDHVVLAPNVTLFSATHDYSDIKLPNTAQSIIIENHVWIGGNTTILPGITIGEGAIIGAGSVVSKDIPAWTVSVGNPARVIYERETTQGDCSIN